MFFQMAWVRGCHFAGCPCHQKWCVTATVEAEAAEAEEARLTGGFSRPLHFAAVAGYLPWNMTAKLCRLTANWLTLPAVAVHKN